jgi:hypothetical protein
VRFPGKLDRRGQIISAKLFELLHAHRLRLDAELITWMALVGHGCAPAAEAPATRTAPVMALHKAQSGVI